MCLEFLRLFYEEFHTPNTDIGVVSDSDFYQDEKNIIVIPNYRIYLHNIIMDNLGIPCFLIIRVGVIFPD